MNNPDILQLLLGEWSGSGKGEFPTIEPFEYLETITFSSDGRPFLHYGQKTRRRRAGQTDYFPSHWESGFIRLLPDGQVELTCAQNGGRLEMLRGSLEETEIGLILRLKSTAFLNDPRMLETSRRMILEGDSLHYTQNMHTTAVPGSTRHVEATLNRISEAQPKCESAKPITSLHLHGSGFSCMLVHTICHCDLREAISSE